ncbi:MAG: hypothetical protein QOG02_937, partial [Gaiellales bacterium]|nr:hypothetical protein [Gaiellales bacterium]
DTLSAVEGVVGPAASDTLTGTSGITLLFGIGGNDVIDGGGGFDYAGFLTAAVNANLTTGVATGEGSDTLKRTEGLLAGVSPSTLTGNAVPNVLLGADGSDALYGGAGGDILAGGLGADTLQGQDGGDRLVGGGGDDHVTGGNGTDLLDDSAANGPVTINLATGLTSGDQGVDVLGTVDDAVGGAYADNLIGNGLQNRLVGLGGNDVLSGGASDDLLEAGAGTDTADGGTGADICRAAETNTSCETVTAADPAGLAAATAGVTGLTHSLSVSAASTKVASRAIRNFLAVRCSTYFNNPLVYVPMPNIYSLSGYQEAVQWTAYLYKWDAPSQTWQWVVTAPTYNLTAFNGDSGNAGLFQFGYGTDAASFTIYQAGYYRVADYVFWPQYNDYSFDWAGTHAFSTGVSDYTGSESYVYDWWCYFPLAAAAANTATPTAGAGTPPPANTPLPAAPPGTTGNRIE